MVYRGIGPEKGILVKQEQAFQYALERCLNGTLEEQKEFREMLEEWYFSGNWIEEEQEEDDGEWNEYLRDK